MLHMWQNAVVAAPDFAVCYDNFLGQLSSPKAIFSMIYLPLVPMDSELSKTAVSFKSLSRSGTLRLPPCIHTYMQTYTHAHATMHLQKHERMNTWRVQTCAWHRQVTLPLHNMVRHGPDHGSS